MKITIIYDNTAHRENLRAGWGFSALVEAEGRTILFDTGAEGAILLENMSALGVDPRSVEEVFISHTHHDHMGGLADFLRINPVRVILPRSAPVLQGVEVIRVKGPMEIHPQIFSTGELRNEEQSLVVETDRGLVVIVGCSHPGVGTILDAASRFGKVRALIGGLHGFNDLEMIEDLELVCPTHCTARISQIRSRYPEKYLKGGAGRVIEI
ncbi:MAG: MBL fold metallo-hydrolase [Euryarchaeota archaeon]|nr:MBL fold metallo-hydrolase [Euryarchaeota archaeon]